MIIVNTKINCSIIGSEPAPSAVSQHPEAWPAREGYLSVPCEGMYRPILTKLATGKEGNEEAFIQIEGVWHTLNRIGET